VTVAIGTFADFEALKLKTDQMESEIDRIALLCDFAVSDERLMLKGDPFSASYLSDVFNSHRIISGNAEYSAQKAELSPFVDPEKSAAQPSIYGYGDSSFLGEFMISFGAILRAMKLRAGESVLEYGAGDGQISLMLARLGCKVSVVDVEQRYLDAIKLQGSALKTNVDTLCGEFGDNFPDGRKFDCILFFEAFHHCIQHQDVLVRIKDFLTPNGRIIFSGEPIVDPDGYWKDVVPFPWGPRLDALSLRAMRWYGWCELGFQRPYFEELLRRSGFSFEFVSCPMTARGDCYIATPIKENVEPEAVPVSPDALPAVVQEDTVSPAPVEEPAPIARGFLRSRIWPALPDVIRQPIRKIVYRLR
jgi:2-polyprenyl-3-methyl-5-hydroxy-6-metoxy-1,4-benzoquinol methylase